MAKIKLINYKLVFLDTNIFIYHFHHNPSFTAKTDYIFNFLSSNQLKATTSLLTLAELLALKTEKKHIRKIENAFNQTPNLEIITPNYQIMIKAAEIKRLYQLTLPDSIQLSTAVYTKASAFITNDQKLKKFKKVKIVLLNQL